VDIKEGFYKGECIHFLVHVGDTYPYDPPKIHALSQIYHPFIAECGLVKSPILSHNHWQQPLQHMKEQLVGQQHEVVLQNKGQHVGKQHVGQGHHVEHHVGHAILEVQNLFLDPLFLTNYFTL